MVKKIEHVNIVVSDLERAVQLAGDALLLLLDAAGVECSRGSACSAGVPQPSHVLLAMGIDPVTARSSLRFSLGRTSMPSDVDRLLEVLPGAVARARRAGQAR